MSAIRRRLVSGWRAATIIGIAMSILASLVFLAVPVNAAHGDTITEQFTDQGSYGMKVTGGHVDGTCILEQTVINNGDTEYRGVCNKAGVRRLDGSACTFQITVTVHNLSNATVIAVDNGLPAAGSNCEDLSVQQRRGTVAIMLFNQDGAIKCPPGYQASPDPEAICRALKFNGQCRPPGAEVNASVCAAQPLGPDGTPLPTPPPPGQDPRCPNGFRFVGASCVALAVNGQCPPGGRKAQGSNYCITEPTAAGWALEPICGAVNHGPIRCPVNDPNINYDATGCYVINPDSPDAAQRVYRPADCTDPAFALVANATCDANTPATIREANCESAARCQENCNLVQKYIDPLIKVLTALVGIGITIALVWGAIRYSRSSNSPREVAAAKVQMFRALLTLLGFLLFFSFLNWVVPGGL